MARKRLVKAKTFDCGRGYEDYYDGQYGSFRKGSMSCKTPATSKGDEMSTSSEGCGIWEANTTPKFISAIRDDDWRYLLNSILYLFHKKKLQKKLELDLLQEKVRNVRNSKIGAFIAEYYQDSILKKGMIVLRETIKDKTGDDLLECLTDSWKQFYTCILPTVLAIFYPIQEQGIYLRSVTLIGFRDMVLLKTKIHDALHVGMHVVNEIKQMLLILASVHDTNPPNENYMRLEYLVTRVVRPYLGYNGLYLVDKSPDLTRRRTNNNDNDNNNSSNNPVKGFNELRGCNNREKMNSRPPVTKTPNRSLIRSFSEGLNNNSNSNHKTVVINEIYSQRRPPGIEKSISLSGSCDPASVL